MKRNIKKSSRRKWVVGGIAFFGSVALLTTGFATWVVGVNDNNENEDVSVAVETTTNESVSFVMEYASESPDNKITIDEPNPVSEQTDGKGYVKQDGDIIQPQFGDGQSKWDFTVTFKNVEIVIGNTAYEENTYNAIQFAIKKGAGNEVASSLLGEGVRTGKDWTYLAAPVTQTFEELGISKGSGNDSAHVFSGSNVDINFGWGTFFYEDTPCAFYNELYHGSKLTGIGDDNAIVNAIYNEMDAMSRALKGKTITLEATLIVKGQ